MSVNSFYKRSAFWPILLCFLISAGFLSCDSMFSKKQENKSLKDNEPVYLKVNISDASRTALPEFNRDSISDFNFTLKGKGPGASEFSVLTDDPDTNPTGVYSGRSTFEGISFPVSTGDWSFQLTASKDGTVLSAQTTKTITAATNSLSFVLKWDNSDLSGSGNLSFKITFTDAQNKEDVKAVTGQLYNYNPSNGTKTINSSYSETELTLAAGTDSVTYSLTNVDAGNYWIIIRFYSDEEKTMLLNSWSELAIITGGQTSSKENTMPSFNHSYVVNADGSITYDDGLLDITADFSEKLYVNEGSVTFGATLKNGGTDVSTSSDVTWNAKLLYGGKDINDYGSYYSFTAPSGTNPAKLEIADCLETPGTYQVFVTAQYEGVVSSQTFYYQASTFGLVMENLNLEDSSVKAQLESEITKASQSGASVILTITGTGSDGTDGVGGSLSYLIEKLSSISNTIEMDISGVEDLYTVAAGIFGAAPKFTKIVLPQDLNAIAAGAFVACSTLEYITIPDSVNSIGAYAFPFYNSNIKQFTITGDTSYPTYSTALDGAFLINNDSSTLEYVAAKAPISIIDFSQSAFEAVVNIADSAFMSNLNIQTITSFGNVKTIGETSFAGCANLTSVNLQGVVSIGKEAFSGDKALTQLGNMNAVSEIHRRAFYSTGITQVTIPAGVELINDEDDSDGRQTFYECENLTTITISSEYSDTFDGSEFDRCDALEQFIIDGSDYGTQNIQYYARDVGSATGALLVKKVISPASVTLVKAAASADFETIDFRSGNLTDITAIDSYAFALDQRKDEHEYSHLQTITSFGNVKTVGEYAFQLSNLTTISDFGSLEKIGDSAFASSQLTTIPAITSGMTIGTYPFNNTKVSRFQLDSYSITGRSESFYSYEPVDTELVINFEIDTTTNVGAIDFLRPDGGSPVLSGLTTLKTLVVNQKSILPDLTYENDNEHPDEYPDESYVKENRDTYKLMVFSDIGRTVESISFNGSGTVIGDYQFYCNNTYYDPNYILFENLTTIDLSGVTVVGEKAFGNTALTGQVELPSTLIAIGASAFENVDSDFELVIDDSDPGNWYYTADQAKWKGWIDNPTSFDPADSGVTAVSTNVAATLTSDLTTSGVTRYFYKYTN